MKDKLRKTHTFWWADITVLLLMFRMQIPCVRALLLDGSKEQILISFSVYKPPWSSGYNKSSENAPDLPYFSKEALMSALKLMTAGAQLEEVATPGLFVVNLICALLVIAFFPHFSKPCRCTSLEIIEVALSVPWYYHPTPALRNFLLRH